MKHIGEYLKQRRCEKNITLEEVASQTGIREQYLTALESGDFEKIPGDVFIKGFIRNYATSLKKMAMILSKLTQRALPHQKPCMNP